jgi:translation elongation factor EF-1alpha
MSERLNVTLLGHKDHGKSTLIGRLAYDTGSVKEDRVHEVKATSEALGKPFEYAFLLDAFQEEREGGMTIDVIHAQIKGKRFLYDCIDVPGHSELIKNMLTGASHADAGILIVSASEGIEPQTGQHLRLARWLGLGHLIVAINKMDLVDYDRRVFDEMKVNLVALFGGGTDAVSFIPVAALQGENVVNRSEHMPWYTGPTLYEALESITVREELPNLPLRLPVQGVYAGSDGEPLVVGRVEAGSLQVGQRISFVPSGFTATVKAIVVSNEKRPAAVAGDNVGVLLDQSPAALTRGEVGCPAEALVKLTREVTAPTIFLEPAPRTLTVECGTAQTQCDVEHLSQARIGEVGQVLLRFERPLVTERSRSTIGRMALKHQGKIVGVAVVA